MNKRRFLIPALLAVVATALAFAAQVPTLSADAVTQPENRFGLASVELHDSAYLSVPRFFLDGRPDGVSSAGAKVALWDFVKPINGGEHLPTLRQETGDCTAFSSVQGQHYLQAKNIFNGEQQRFEELHPSYNYGVSRTAPDIGNGRLGRSAGAVGQWSVEAPKRYGALPKSAPGVPAYSGALSDQWGRSGPPKELHQYATAKLGSYARCEGYEDIRDAISSGYPVTIASNQGFRMQPTKYDGRMFGSPSGSWAHQMLFIAVDDTAKCPDGSTGAVYCQNSWGAAAHGQPANDEPPGGFWVSRKVCERMATSGEAYALSEFSGFPYKPFNIRIFGSSTPEKLIAVSDVPPGVKYLAEYAGLDRHTTRYAAAGVLLVAAVTLIPPRRRFRTTGISRNLTA